MEWFFGPKGLKFSEIGCRPPGVRAWDLYAVGNDIDLYREWAMADRARPAGAAARRAASPPGSSRCAPTATAASPATRASTRCSSSSASGSSTPTSRPTGTPTQPVEAGYMANAWMRLKHPDYDHLRWMLDPVGQTVKVRAR